MRFFRDGSLKRKLTLLTMVTSGTALASASVAFLAYERMASRREALQELVALADVIGANSASALIMNDPQDVTLWPLRAQERIVMACIYARDHTLLARHARPGLEAPCPTPDPAGDAHRFDGDGLVLFRRIAQDGEVLGTLFLRSDLRPLASRLHRYAGIAVLTLFTSWLLAFVLSSRLQQAILRPILDLAERARALSESRDTAIRRLEPGQDEVGSLLGSFDEMLGQIERRDRELQEAHASLEQRVQERTRELEERTLELQREIREREEAEEALRESERRLRLSQKIEAIGRLAGGVAHDFNNVLSVILGYTDMLLSEEESPRQRERLQEVHKAARRAASLTQQLLAFSRRQVLQPTVLDLNAVMADMEKMLQRLIGEDITLVSVPGRLAPIKADRGQIEHVIMNLAINAREAMPRGGRLILETADVVLDAAYARSRGVSASGPFVMLAVTDTGGGMDAETQTHVFEPFFTTKEKGTGLGLATVYGIVRQSGGYIWIYSELGRGTTFKIYLPHAHEPLEPARSVPASSVHGWETILLVEDEEPLRKMSQEALQRKGYHVLDAADGRQALLLCRRYSGRIHLMVTDMVMPEMNGPDLAERVLTLRQGIRILYTSGYAEEAVLQKRPPETPHAFLAKPFTDETLATKVREVLDA